MLADRTADLRHEDLAGRRWAGYLRESTRGQADRYGPDLQRAEHRRYAERYGLVATGLEYVDLVSGKDTLRRTDFQPHAGRRRGRSLRCAAGLRHQPFCPQRRPTPTAIASAWSGPGWWSSTAPMG